jgi:hypothetical protein
MNDFDSLCADTRQTDRDVQVVRELVDGQSCHVGKCLLLPSTPTSRRYKLHMDPWSKKTLRSHELWTQTTTDGLFSRLWSQLFVSLVLQQTVQQQQQQHCGDVWSSVTRAVLGGLF